MKGFIKLILVIIQIVLVLAIAKEIVARNGNSNYNGQAVSLDFYVMSICPYGLQVEDAIAPVLNKFGNAIDFNIDFIARETNDGFSSLHGQPEVDGNIVQLCAMKYNPNKYMDMIVCMNKDAQNIPDNWENCVNGLDKESIKTCYEGEEGKELLKESIKASNEVGATGSPTIYLNDQPYNGGRDEISFTKAICQLLDKHPKCKNMPECSVDADCTAEVNKNGICNKGNCEYEDAVEVKVTVLTDKNCKTCDTTQIVGVTEKLFKGAKYTYIDVSDDEAKELIEKNNIKVAPAYIFDSEITNTQSWTTNAQLQGAFAEIEDGYKIIPEAAGSSWIINEKQRATFYKEIGVDLNDNKVQLDFFVMSYCPYGNTADEIASEVYDVLGNNAIFNPRYIIYSNYNGGGPSYCLDEDNVLCSMHGIQELNQNIREVCVDDLFGIEDWFSFALEMNTKCNAGNADTCWTNVAKSLKLDADKISSCEETKGNKLMTDNKEIGDKLGVSGSPTLFIEGDKYNGQRDANSLLKAMCGYYDEKPEGCNQFIDTEVTVTTGNC